MTTINLIQDFVNPFDPNNYSYSYDFTSNIQTEDEINDIEVVDLSTNTISVTFRSSDYYDYVSSTYESASWYQITPIPLSLFNILFSSTSYSQSDIYYFTAPVGLTFIAYNQPSIDTLVYDGTWTNGFISMYGLKLLVSTVTK